jgi:hypothetical protein
MKKMGLAVAAAALGFSMVVGSSFVPGTANEASAAVSRSDRVKARNMAKVRRAECRREAAAARPKLGMIKRMRFVRSCMRRTG